MLHPENKVEELPIKGLYFDMVELRIQRAKLETLVRQVEKEIMGC